MISIPVKVSKEYCVKIGAGSLRHLGQEAAALIRGRSAVIVSDGNVWPLYGSCVTASLKEAGFTVHSFQIAPGESSKNLLTYGELVTFLAEKQITRSDCLIALGGGVVGDLTGFAAATYLRCIGYIQVPTTLLAMVDSSVGGKTAIDLPIGKNLVGAFYQPKLVLCDPDTLKTLPRSVFIDGCAEVIKYAVLYDAPMFAQLEQSGIGFDREDIIARCIQWKNQVVSQDEFDTGLRQMLNLGHTLGHSIESLSNYQISHGAAVSIGMATIARCAAAHGDCSVSGQDRILHLLSQFGLPITTDFPLDQLLIPILSDKKRSGDGITLVIPSTIGCAQLYHLPIEQLRDFIKEGL